MTTVGFLHTSRVHVPTFDALMAELAPGTGVVSIVDVDLLDQARTRGIDDPALADGVARALDALAAGGATRIACTCSTIGGLAERIGMGSGRRVVRVDRPMAERAVAIGGRILVLAALASTVGPTTDLLLEVAAERDRDVDLEVAVVDAWSHFESRDAGAYHRAIADAVIAAAGNHAPDVIVLAQASMAPVADMTEVGSLGVPVLASPRTAVESLVESLGGT
jgi:hypothetical protein